MGSREKVLVGHISGAHGIKGEVRLKSYTTEPAAIAAYLPLETASGVVIEIEKLRAQKDGFIAVLKGVSDRNTAEALKGADLFIPRSRLPEPEGNEVYVHDLLGLPVELADGTQLGEIVGIENYGAGDLIDVKVEGRKDTLLIPFAGDYVVKTKEDKVVIDLPEGFLDEGVKE